MTFVSPAASKPLAMACVLFKRIQQPLVYVVFNQPTKVVCVFEGGAGEGRLGRREGRGRGGVGGGGGEG